MIRHRPGGVGLRTELAGRPPARALHEAVRVAILTSNQANAANAANAANRDTMLAPRPLLGAPSQAGTRSRFEDLRASAVADFVAGRLGCDPGSLPARSADLTAFAPCRAAAEQWQQRPVTRLLDLLARALLTWSDGVRGLELDA